LLHKRKTNVRDKIENEIERHFTISDSRIETVKYTENYISDNKNDEFFCELREETYYGNVQYF